MACPMCRTPHHRLGHLLDAEVTLGFRIRKLAAEPGGTIVAWDQEKWTAGLRHQGGDARTLFAASASGRCSSTGRSTTSFTSPRSARRLPLSGAR
jgi:hypothetical protein